MNAVFDLILPDVKNRVNCRVKSNEIREKQMGGIRVKKTKTVSCA